MCTGKLKFLVQKIRVFEQFTSGSESSHRQASAEFMNRASALLAGRQRSRQDP